MIDLESSNLGDLELRELELCLRDSVVSTRGSFTKRFEIEMAKYLGVNSQNVLATNSGTSALYLALKCCDLPKEDYVILPALTYIATANAVMQNDYFPIFVDVELDSWCIRPYKIPSSILDSARVIIGVNLYGNICDWNGYPEGKYLIEDACESLGVKIPYHDLMGFTCYSFNGNKVFTTGGGGLLVSARYKKDINMARILASQGMDNGEFISPGFNYRMPALNASLGLSQLKRLPEFLEKKKRINDIYRNELSGICKFQEPHQGTLDRFPKGLHSYWFTAGTFEVPATFLMKKLNEKGIPVRRVFKPIPSEKFYSKFCNGETFPNAQRIYEYGLCLPSGTLNSEKDIYETCKTIKSIL